jgi:hypothetical protein
MRPYLRFYRIRAGAPETIHNAAGIVRKRNPSGLCRYGVSRVS